MLPPAKTTNVLFVFACWCLVIILAVVVPKGQIIIILTSPTSYSTSREAASLLINAIKGTEIFQSETHNEQVQSSKRSKKIKNQEKDNQTFTGILPKFSQSYQRAILRARNSLSVWLTMLPLVLRRITLIFHHASFEMD